MVHLYLPGFGAHNSEFALELAKRFRKTGMTAYARHWGHWAADKRDEDGAKPKAPKDPKSFDFTEEIRKTEQVIKGIGKSKLGIITKSIGNIVATKINLYKVKLEYMLLMGIPVSTLSEAEKQEWLAVVADASCPVYLIQNKLDPHGSAESLEQILKQDGVSFQQVTPTEASIQPGIQLISQDRSDHTYEDIESIMRIARLFDSKEELAV
jgi:hypothetical protein